MKMTGVARSRGPAAFLLWSLAALSDDTLAVRLGQSDEEPVETRTQAAGNQAVAAAHPPIESLSAALDIVSGVSTRALSTKDKGQQTVSTDGAESSFDDSAKLSSADSTLMSGVIVERDKLRLLSSAEGTMMSSAGSTELKSADSMKQSSADTKQRSGEGTAPSGNVAAFASPANVNEHAEAASQGGHQIVPDVGAGDNPTRRSSLATLAGEDLTAIQAGSLVKDGSLAQEETVANEKDMSEAGHNPYHHHPDHYHYDWHDDHPEWHDENQRHRHGHANLEDRLLGGLIGQAFGGGGQRDPVDAYFAGAGVAASVASDRPCPASFHPAGNPTSSVSRSGGYLGGVLNAAAKSVAGTFR